MKRKQVYLPDNLIKKVTEIAKEKGLSFSEMLRRIVDLYLEKQ